MGVPVSPPSAFAPSAEWELLGYPLTVEGWTTVTHPLALLLQNAERDAQRFSHEVAVQSRKLFVA
jgi:hypothetical protein